MSFQTNNLLGIPSEPRIFFIFTPLSNHDLDNLALVNRQVNAEVAECYKIKCERIIPYLNKLSLFFNPLVKTMNNPWKLVITFCNAEPKEKWAVAEKIAKETAPRFGSLIEKQKFDYQDKFNKNAAENRLICGDYYQDPNSPIQQAWLASESSLTPEEKKEIEELENYVKSWIQDADNTDLYWTANMVTYWKAIREAGEQKITVSQALRNSDVDPKVIRYFELEEKKDEAHKLYASLEFKRSSLSGANELINKEISFRQRILDNYNCLKNFSEEMIYHILYLSPYTTKVLSTGPIIKEIQKDIKALNGWDNESLADEKRKELISRIKENINRLPAEKSREIWSRLYRSCVQVKQENQTQLHMNIEYFCRDQFFKDLLKPIDDAMLHETSSDTRERLCTDIRVRINMLPPALSNRIWKSLYEKCAASNITPNEEEPVQWAEKHLSEHLDALYACLIDMKYGKALSWSEQHFSQHLVKLWRVLHEVMNYSGLPDDFDYDPVARYINEKFFERNKIDVFYPHGDPS